MPPSNALPLFLGIGLSGGASPEDAVALAEEAIARSGFSVAEIACVATIISRLDDPALLAIASRFGCGIAYFETDVLEAETPRLKNPSEALFARIGCHGVAEAAALAAAGGKATLVVEKISGRKVTAAVAIRPAVF